MQTLAPLLLGCCFGWVLHKGRLGRYETVVNVFLFRDLTVLKFLLSALMVSALGIQACSALGLAVPMPVAETYLVGNLVGGLVFGVGMATAGFCPGTVAAGAGEGRLDYLVAGSLGLGAGALLYGIAYPKLVPLLANPLHLGPVTLGQLLGVDTWLLVALFWELGLLLFYALERGAPRLRG
ncbi:MAG: YeeE/YedE thiosulfate transporter family protein [Polyangiales bacterium]